MPISKRLRFEILRRDNHTCRYCGGTAPDVTLRVDHVVPRALGGSDEPSNLVAACHDCNIGKTSSAPDQHVVDDVNQRAVQWADAMAQAAEELLQQADLSAELYSAFDRVWPGFYRNRLPVDYRNTLDQLFSAGLPAAVIAEMAQVAVAKKTVDDRWRYFCGCCWTKVRQLQGRALEIAGDQAAPNDPKPAEAALEERVNDLILYSLDELIYKLPAENVRIYNGHVCAHEIHWKVQDVSRAVYDDEPFPCEDIACRSGYSELINAEAKRCRDLAERDRAVMDEAEELELVDG